MHVFYEKGKCILAMLLIAPMLFTGCGQLLTTKPSGPQLLVNQMAQQLRVTYEVVNTHAGAEGADCKHLGAEWAACQAATIHFENNGDQIRFKDWEIYFHSIRRVLQCLSPQFEVTHINGDLYRLTPTEKFETFPAKRNLDLPLILEYWTLFETDVMPRFYVTAPNALPRVFKNTDTELTEAYVKPISPANHKRNLNDNNIQATAQTRFAANRQLRILAPDDLASDLIPTPLVKEVTDGFASLAGGVLLDAPGLPANTQVACIARLRATGVAFGNGYPIHVVISDTHFDDQPDLKKEGGYTLEITEKAAKIVGYDIAGAFYGVQSLAALISFEQPKRAPLLTIKDAPRFGHRGFMLDVARNFHSKGMVLRLMDQMAAYKLNKLHLHLADDEGWRLEIPGLPELTEIGSKRGHDLTEQRCILPQLGSGPGSDNAGTGFFSVADYIEIIKYADARCIRIIPEIDMPAHARAAVVSMEARYRRYMDEGMEAEANQYRLLDPDDTSNYTTVQFYDDDIINPCLDSTYAFIDKVIGEIAAMHASAGQPLQVWHMGGDEAKNIMLGAGFEGLDGDTAWKGSIDQSREDMPWSRSPVCRAYMETSKDLNKTDDLHANFVTRVSWIAHEHGIPVLAAWNDGVKGIENPDYLGTASTYVNAWDTLYWGGSEAANKLRAHGFKVVASFPDYLYFDFPYEVHPKERGYYWATRFTNTQKVFTFAPENLPQNAETSVDRDGNLFSVASETPYTGFLGMQGQMWSETVRTDAQAEYMIFPRLLALAERAWHRADWELSYIPGRVYKGGKTHYVDKQALTADWEQFANLMGHRELRKLDLAGLAYRLPVPGAIRADGLLTANIAFPGLEIQYSLNNSGDWRLYRGPVFVGYRKVALRTVSPDGKRFSRSTEIK